MKVINKFIILEIKETNYFNQFDVSAPRPSFLYKTLWVGKYKRLIGKPRPRNAVSC
jgi:hypothetical protein